MRGRSSVLSEKQRSELQLENFIYHIIKTNQDEPEYLEEVILSSERQREFFRGIVSETGQGTQYLLIDKDSDFVGHCKNIIEDAEGMFVSKSRRLASAFLAQHKSGRTSDGVFIVARVSVPVGLERKPLVAVIKLDYTPVLRQEREKGNHGKVKLEEIIEALSEQKSSVQKRAIIDISNNFEWDVLAVERKKVGNSLDTEDALTEYFKSFLGVRLKENDSTITKKLVKACYGWAKSYDGNLNGKTASDIRHSVIALCDAYEDKELTYDDIFNHICVHSDDNELNKIRVSFGSYMDEEGLGGISFSPKPKSIGGRDRKGMWKTDTGIKIIWNGERDESELKKEKQNDGSYIITICANGIEEGES